MIKDFLKRALPENVYQWLRHKAHPARTYSPSWNTLSYDPVAGVRMYFDSTGAWQKQLLDSSYDSFFLERVKKMDLKGRAVYDIGAHIGFHSLYFARLVGQTGKIYAFEPHPKNVERLTMCRDANADLKDRISVFPFAVSNKAETLEFTLNNDIESGRSSGGFIEKADAIWTPEEFAKRGFFKTSVRALPLDKAVAEFGLDKPPALMKIDVEGAEALVLEGAAQTIDRFRPVILIETHSPSAHADTLSFLTAHSYTTEILKKETDGRIFIEARP